MNLSSTIKSIQDIMRKDAGTYGDAQRIEQMAWLFFLKIFDDRETELELMRDAYKSPPPEPFRWRSRAADEEGITGDALLGCLATLHETGNQRKIFRAPGGISGQQDFPLDFHQRCKHRQRVIPVRPVTVGAGKPRFIAIGTRVTVSAQHQRRGAHGTKTKIH